MKEIPVSGDGNCFYRTVGFFLNQKNYTFIKKSLLDYIDSNKNSKEKLIVSTNYLFVS